METATATDLREHTLQCAKNFKTGWIELGRALYTIWKDKHYKTWGYGKFDAYTSKEVNIRKLTALKLLRSYFFLEKEEPEYLKDEYISQTDTASIPNYEAVDVLRLAKGKKALDNSDYNQLKKNVLGRGKDAKEIKRDLTAIIRQREELNPEEAWEKKKDSNVKRLLSVLKSLKREIEATKVIPAATIKEISRLIDTIEIQIK